MLSRLIYQSTSLCSAEDARRLCIRAREANEANGVSGALYLVNGVFLQYLEGDEAFIAALYARIQKDIRHTRCELLDSRPISARIFKGWAMAWLPVTVESDLLMKAIVRDGPAARPLDGAAAGALFVALSRVAERQ